MVASLTNFQLRRGGQNVAANRIGILSIEMVNVFSIASLEIEVKYLTGKRPVSRVHEI